MSSNATFRIRRSLLWLPVSAVALLLCANTAIAQSPESPSDSRSAYPANGGSNGNQYADGKHNNHQGYESIYPGYYNFANDKRGQYPDSIRYYGPGRSWAAWDAAKLYNNKTWTLGRDTWWFYTAGSERFYRALSVKLGELEVSVEFFRALDTRRRNERFKELGLINEPNFVRADEPNEYGLWLDAPIKNNPMEPSWIDDPYYPKDEKNYGIPTGVVGLRMFRNQRFTDDHDSKWKAEWKTWWAATEKGTKLPDDPTIKSPVATYMDNPGRVEPPYLVGITCAFCHVAYDPTNPPKDVNNPRWENLSANIGNQYFREGDLFFGWGKISGGNAHPKPGHDLDPYQSGGLGDKNLLYQYGQLQQSGTSETSRFSYDFINNPNTINQIFYIGQRARFFETAPDGREVQTFHVLKDGADSVGVPAALARVFVNIGGEPEYWLDRLWNPLEGSGPHPFSIAEVNLEESVPAWRRQELKEKIPTIGRDWQNVVSRMPALANYLISYQSPFYLQDAVGRAVAQGHPEAEKLKQLLPDHDRVRNGASKFAKYCAKCHSNRQPTYPVTEGETALFYKQSVLAGDFREGNTLTNDVRYPVTKIGTNSGRAFATNAIAGEIWAEFSSNEYKSLPSVGTMRFETPLNRLDPVKFGTRPLQTAFVAPAGGRGYYRTASLVSLWTSAPYLHNNSVGDDPYVRGEGISADVVTIQGRMKMFNSAMRQMLLLDDRWSNERSIKVTTEESSLLSGMERTKRRIKSEAIWRLVRPKIDKIARDKLKIAVEDPAIQEIAAAAIAEALEQARPKLPEILEKFEATTLKDEIKPQVTALIREFVHQRIAKKLQAAPLPDKIKNIVLQVAQDKELKLFEAISDGDGLPGISPASLAFPTIPKGTPLNLILNQNIRNLPYVVQAIGKYKKDPRRLTEELLRISDCPDLVETKGHVFPTLEERKADGLCDEDLEDLIEFLKTL